MAVSVCFYSRTDSSVFRNSESVTHVAYRQSAPCDQLRSTALRPGELRASGKDNALLVGATGQVRDRWMGRAGEIYGRCVLKVESLRLVAGELNKLTKTQ